MKQKIKDFLFQRRFKPLKNKRGFSLMEVLIAVAIIGIISAIAVPQFTAQKDNAAKVASDTSAGNIAKAFKNCTALDDFDNCDTLSKIKVSCPAGTTCVSGGTGGKFCAHLHKGTGANQFKVCISVDGDGSEIRSYGGGLLSSVVSGDVCHHNKTVGGTCPATSPSPMAGLIPCNSGNISAKCGDDEPAVPASNQCGDAYTCATPTTDGDCDPATGNCS